MLAALLLIPLFTGFVFVVAGFLMFKFPPKKINAWYGYRTTASMKNQERWRFAQTYAAKQMMKGGVVLMLLSLVGLAFEPNRDNHFIIGLILLLGVIASLFLSVERAIQKQFSEH